MVAQWLMNPIGIMRLQVRSLASLSGLRIWHCCELWCRLQSRLGSDVAVAVFRPLAWEPPYAAGAAQEIATITTTTKKDKRQKKKKNSNHFH